MSAGIKGVSAGQDARYINKVSIPGQTSVHVLYTIQQYDSKGMCCREAFLFSRILSHVTRYGKTRCSSCQPYGTCKVPSVPWQRSDCQCASHRHLYMARGDLSAVFLTLRFEASSVHHKCFGRTGEEADADHEIPEGIRAQGQPQACQLGDYEGADSAYFHDCARYAR
jgi:hypothetical protein